MASTNESLPLLKGTVDMLVLKALSWGPMHGFGIALLLEQQSRGELGLDDSIVYQVLHRLEGRGLISAQWKTTANKRRARYYTLSPAGRARLSTETETWLRYSRSVTAIMTAKAPRPATA